MRLIEPFRSEFEDFRGDESRRVGEMSAVSFPQTEKEVVEVLRTASEQGQKVTIQGARTGIVAGAVPQGGIVLNMNRMNQVCRAVSSEDGEYSMVVQPGAALADIRKAAEAEGLFFPPDPTEASASIGGMVSCNASGASTFHYGSTRRWVRALRVVLADGDVLALRRGEVNASGRSFSLTTLSGRVIEGELPALKIPSVKSTAGYFCAEGMDLLDLFIGMEGTLGAITEIELRLIPKPLFRNGITIFLSSQKSALSLVRVLRGEELDGYDVFRYAAVSIEYFNNKALDLLRKMKTENTAFKNIPALKPGFGCAVYAEFHGSDEAGLDEAIFELTDVIERLGGKDDDTWFAGNARDLERMRDFRHAVPEAVNLLIGERKRENPELTKLGTDMSVPDAELEAVFDMYDSGLSDSGLDSVIFGHIGDNHLHVNILPRTMDEYRCGKEMYLRWAKKVVEMDGSVSAEHGIGKLKTSFLSLMYGDEGIKEMMALRKVFDPDGILNPGNLFQERD